MSPGGRRPGKLSARDDIIRAAQETFAQEGYDGTSLRAVARAAGVDAALIHHYFDGKAGLFMAAMALPFDPRQVQLGADAASPSTLPGAAVVEGFLTMWDLAEGTGSSFVSCVGAMAASPAVADAMRERRDHRCPPGPGGVPTHGVGLRPVRAPGPADLDRLPFRDRALGRADPGAVRRGRAGLGGS